MAANRRRVWYDRGWIGALAVLFTAGCETARMPLELNPAGAPAPLKYTSLVGEPARAAWIAGLSSELESVNQRMRRGPAAEPALAERAVRLGGLIEDASSAADSTDEDAGIIKFGTRVFLSIDAAGSVIAFTETSRATKITHTIRIAETSEGRTYTHPALIDDSGFMPKSSLFTSIDLDRCTKPMTVVARTHHEAGSLSFRHRQALSDADASCNPPPPPCPSDREAPISYSCTEGGGGGGDGTTRMTCYTVTIEYYWYYPDTDTYEYRYTETSTWCEAST